jgi:nitrate/nitrite transport system ATP-binding protein
MKKRPGEISGGMKQRVGMTNGPAAQIGELRQVSLSRPRNRLELVADPSYIAARSAVLEFLHRKSHFVEAA